MKKVLKSVLNWLLFLFTCSGPVADEAERDCLLKRGGQE